MQEIRWEQRFSNFKKALHKLTQAVDYLENQLESVRAKSLKDQTVLKEILKEGLIQRFEYTYEMAWNVMKDYALYQGNNEIGGSRDAIRFVFSIHLIKEGDL